MKDSWGPTRPEFIEQAHREYKQIVMEAYNDFNYQMKLADDYERIKSITSNSGSTTATASVSRKDSNNSVIANTAVLVKIDDVPPSDVLDSKNEGNEAMQDDLKPIPVAGFETTDDITGQIDSLQVLTEAASDVHPLPSVSANQVQTADSPQIPAVAGWIEAYKKDGTKYYFNINTGNSSLKPPKDFHVSPVSRLLQF